MSGLGNMPLWLNGLFGSPWMLLWLPTVVVPLVIHLLYRQRYREITWAAMEYLLAAIEKSARRMRVQQWLLLLLRMLLLLLMLLAMAEPLVSKLSPLPLSAGGTHHIFLLDASFSMGYREANETDFERAKQQIIDRIKAGEGGDAYSLILMGPQAEVIVGEPSFDRQQVITALEAVPVGQTGADLSASLTAAEQLIQAANDRETFGQHAITIYSDLGRTTWGDGLAGDTSTVERYAQLARLAKIGSIEVVAVENRDTSRPNTAVVDLDIAGPLSTVGTPTRFVTTLRTFRTEPLPGQRVELWVDGLRINQKTIDLPAGTDTQVSFTHVFSEAGPHSVRVQTTDDRLPFDDRRYLAVDVREKVRILLVQGKPGATMPLRAAMNAADQQVNLTDVEVVDESRLAELELSDYDCIFLCNVAQWTRPEASRLTQYVERGGGLVTILGDQVLVERYNANAFQRSDDPSKPQMPSESRGFLPARIKGVFYDGEYHFPDPKTYAHPFLAPWKGNPRTGLTGVPVLQYFQLEFPVGSSESTILWLDTGDPLLVLTRIGSGWSLLVATDPTESSRLSNNVERPWSLIASWLNAQPFFEGLWKAVVGGRLSDTNAEVGQWIQGKLSNVTGMKALMLEIPGQPTKREKIASQPDGEWSFGPTRKHGIYRLEPQYDLQPAKKAQPELIYDQVYAVNLDTRESDLGSLSPADLPAAWRANAADKSVAAAGSAKIASSALSEIILLGLVVLFLFLEIFLAWWIGNRFA